MKQEVIRDFLNLPGIECVALMDGRSRPYFCGADQTLNFQQKEALAQGIIGVIETIPEGFETFQFQFTGRQVHIYKLEHGMVLLVLTQSNVVYSDYLETIKNLKAVLQADISNAIATFQLMAGSITLSGTGMEKGATPSSSGTLDTWLSALNHLSKFTTQYLGTQVIVNYWKSSRPDQDWLNHFQIDRAAHFTCVDSTSQKQILNADETRWLREWVAAFIKRCAKVIRDFPNLVEQKALSNDQKKLLLGEEKAND